MRKKCLDCILAEKRKAVTDTNSAVATILSLKHTRIVFILPCSLTIFINVFPFLYIKANSKEICEEISFSFLSEKC